jgi:hypothetical protein
MQERLQIAAISRRFPVNKYKTYNDFGHFNTICLLLPALFAKRQYFLTINIVTTFNLITTL